MSNFIHPSLLEGCVATSKILSFREMKLLSLPSPPMWCFYHLFTVWIHWATQMRGVISDRAGRCKSGSICENCVDHSPPKLGTTETWSLFSSSFDEWNVLLFVVFTWRNKRPSVFSVHWVSFGGSISSIPSDQIYFFSHGGSGCSVGGVSSFSCSPASHC